MGPADTWGEGSRFRREAHFRQVSTRLTLCREPRRKSRTFGPSTVSAFYRVARRDVGSRPWPCSDTSTTTHRAARTLKGMRFQSLCKDGTGSNDGHQSRDTGPERVCKCRSNSSLAPAPRLSASSPATLTAPVSHKHCRLSNCTCITACHPQKLRSGFAETAFTEPFRPGSLDACSGKIGSTCINHAQPKLGLNPLLPFAAEMGINPSWPQIRPSRGRLRGSFTGRCPTWRQPSIGSLPSMVKSCSTCGLE